MDKESPRHPPNDDCHSSTAG